MRRTAMRLLPMLMLGVSALRHPRAMSAVRHPRARSSIVMSSIPPQAASALDICREAAKTKTEDPEAICEALLQLEKQMRDAAKDDEGALSRATLAALDGAWHAGS